MKTPSTLAACSLTLIAIAGCSTMNLDSPKLASIALPKPKSPTPASRKATSKRVVKRVRLEAGAPRVFKYMTNFKEMENWMPGLRHVEVDHRLSKNGPDTVGVGTRRVCSLLGMEAHERVTEFDEPSRFAYELIEESSATVPFRSGIGTVQIDPTEDGGCIVTYEVQYETKPIHPMSPFMSSMLSKQLEEGLDNLAWQFGGRRLEP